MEIQPFYNTKIKPYISQLLIFIALIFVVYNVYSINVDIQKNLEMKKQIFENEFSLNNYQENIIIEPDPIYLTINKVLNIMFFLFLISLMYNGKSSKTS